MYAPGLLACCLTGMLDMQAATLIATASLGQTTDYLERVMDTNTSLEETSLETHTCGRTDSGAPRDYQHTLEVPGAAEALSFFEEV